MGIGKSWQVRLRSPNHPTHTPHPISPAPAPWFSVVYLCLPQPHHVMAFHPSQGDKPPERGRAVRKNGRPSKYSLVKNSIIYICTRALHSFLSFSHCRTDSIAISLLPEAIFMPSIQHNLGLPRPRPPLTSAISTLLAIIIIIIITTSRTSPSEKNTNCV